MRMRPGCRRWLCMLWVQLFGAHKPPLVVAFGGARSQNYSPGRERAFNHDLATKVNLTGAAVHEAGGHAAAFDVCFACSSTIHSTRLNAWALWNSAAKGEAAGSILCPQKNSVRSPPPPPPPPFSQCRVCVPNFGFPLDDSNWGGRGDLF